MESSCFIVDLHSLLWTDHNGVLGMVHLHDVFEQFCVVLMDTIPGSVYNTSSLYDWAYELFSPNEGVDGLELLAPSVGYSLVAVFNEFIVRNANYIRNFLYPLLRTVKQYILVTAMTPTVAAVHYL